MRECCGGPSGDRSRSPINVRFMVMVVVAIVIVKLIKKSNATCTLSSTNGVCELLEMAMELCVLVLLCYHGLGQA